MMVTFDVQAALDHGLHHFAAQILIMIGGRHREITFFVARPVAEIIFPAAGIPAAFFCVNKIEAAVLILVETDVIENEELGFGAEIGGVGDAAVLQEKFGLLGNPTGIAFVALLGDRVLDVAVHDQRGGLGERIHQRSGRIGDQEHVALMDRRPTADTRSIHAEAVFKAAQIQFTDRVRHVVLQARNVRKPQVELLGIVFLGKFQHFLRTHPSSRKH